MSASLSDLIHTLEDGREGFQKASESLHDASLRPLLAAHAAERGEMIAELTALVPSLSPRGTAAGALHRGWIDLKAALSSGDDHAILAECERGEDHALEVISGILLNDLDAATRQTIDSIHVRVQAVHQAVRELRDAAQAG